MGERLKEKALQWHPAFFASIQIELEREAEKLIFENEYQLGTKPKEIDVLIIKKEDAKPIKKNLGRIFRKYNIVEYKSPEDSLSIDDFYKVYAYACFYKADTGNVNTVLMEEITISFVCSRYPKKLLKHLKEDRGFVIRQIENGIYYIEGDVLPIQLILTGRLQSEENLWLKNLTNQLKGENSVRKLIAEYKKHKNNTLYRSVMDIIVRANREQFLEVKMMCEALEELMAEELMEMRKRGLEQGLEQGICAFVQDNLEEGIKKERILKKLQRRFSIDLEKAEQYYVQYSQEMY